MTIDVGPLFQPLTVKGKTLRNRIVMPPMVVLRAHTTPDGIEWYGSHARGGVGLVIVEATWVTRFGDELTRDNLRPLVRAIHDGGAVAAIQLYPATRSGANTPAAASDGDIAGLAEDYERAAGIAVAAGFDGVELHGAHGYLLNQFFSPVQNRRGDAYAGPLEARMRLALELTTASKRGAGDDVILLYRHTPVGEGYGVDDSLVLAEALVRAGVDVLDMSPSSIRSPGDHAAPFKRLGVPVIATNSMDVVENALTVLNEERADLVAVGRGLIADAEWANKVRNGRLDEIVRCQHCSRKCYGNLHAGIPVACVRWNGAPSH